MNKALKGICTLMLSSTVIFFNVNAYGQSTVERKLLIGKNRYETAVKVSVEGWRKGSKNVVLVNGTAIVDALSAAPYAKMKDAPILLTEKDSIPNSTKEELKSLGTENVTIIGGEGVISKKVAEQLEAMNINVERLGGINRYDTSLKLALKLQNVKSVAVVNGSDKSLCDAMSIAAPACEKNMAIILCDGKNAEIADKFLKTKNLKEAYIVGGQGVISKDIENKLNAKRLGGQNRGETNGQVLNQFYKNKYYKKIYLVKDGSRDKFIDGKLYNSELVDALSVAPMAAKEEVPIVMVGDVVREKQNEFLQGKSIDFLYEVGGGINKNSSDRIYNIFCGKNQVVNDDNMTILQNAKEKLTLGNISEVTANLILPKVVGNEVDVIWKSSNPNVISDEGIVKRPNLGEKDEDVILTATLKKGQQSVNKEFYVKVKAKNEKTKELVANNSEEFYNIAKDALENFQSTLVLKVKNYNDKDYNLNILNKVVSEYPEIDYGFKFAKSSIVSVGNSNDKIMTINIHYRLDKETMTYEKNAVKEKVKEIINETINDNMSDAEKELAFHDYLVKNAEYSIENYNNQIVVPEDHNAFGVLINGKGVCESYAKAMNELLKAVNINCKYVTGMSKGEGHAWNIVQLDDGEWYNVDVTWDDPVHTNINDKFIEVQHTYFNLTDKEFSKDHIRGALEESYPACNGTKYSKDNMNIKEYDINGNEFITVNNIENLDSEIKKAFTNKSSVLNLKIKNFNMTVDNLLKEAQSVSTENKVNVDEIKIITLGDNYVIYKFIWK